MKTLFCIMLFASFCFAKDTLVFSGVIKNGQDNVDGMRNPNSVAVSPDNKNVYVTSSADDALVVFSRDTITGALAFNACFRDSQGGVDGLNSALSVTICPDNKNVYVTGSRENTIAIFKVVHTVPISAPSDIPIKQHADFSAFSKGRFYTIVFDVTASGNINLFLLNAQGKLVKKVMNNYLTAGNHIVKADFSDVQSGVYFLSLNSGIKTQALKIVIAKQE